MHDDDGGEVEFDAAQLADMEQHMQLLDAVRAGAPLDLAAYSIGWTPLRLRREMQDPSFAELVDQVEGLKDSVIEKVIFEQAKAGREWAVKLWAFNRISHRWKDTRHIQVSGTMEVPVHVIEATRQEVRSIVAGAIGQGGLAALQDRLLGSIIEAEVIEDGEGD